MDRIGWLAIPLIISSLSIIEIHTVRWAPDLAGDYCQTPTGPRCCSGRLDSCSKPILGKSNENDISVFL